MSALVNFSRLPQVHFWEALLRFLLPIKRGEVFLAAAGELFTAKNNSRMALAISVIVEGHSLKGPAFIKGFGCSQACDSPIDPQ